MNETNQAIPLIQKDDGFETVRDTIAAILAVESAAQQAAALAEVPPLDPTPWEFRVFTERINPWELFRDGDDVIPIVNVWFDSSTYDKASSNVATRQKTDPSRFNVDMYAQGVSTATAEGHTPGDEAAARASHHIAKLCRNILMHDKYKYLGLRGTVWRRWVGQLTAFQPQSGAQALNRVAAVRLVLEVEHQETIDLADRPVLEIIHVDLKHSQEGEIIAELEYNFGS